MTEIRYTQKSETVRISVVGHALYNPGNDPVCASVSAITFQLLGMLEDLYDNDMITDFYYDVHDGSVIVQFSLVPEEHDEWQTIWSVIHKGYSNLAEAYPDNVVID